MVEPKPIWKKYARQIGSFPPQKQGWQFTKTAWNHRLVIVVSGCHEWPSAHGNQPTFVSGFPTQNTTQCSLPGALWGNLCRGPEGSIHLIWPAFCSIFTPTENALPFEKAELVSGWTNPVENYSNWIISPKIGVKIKNVWSFTIWRVIQFSKNLYL